MDEPAAPSAEAPPQAPAEATKPPRWRRRKEARPEELVEAALALFVEQGFAATNLKDVAKRAGVSKGTVYLYFKSKEELLRAVVRDSVVPIIDATDDLELASDADPATLLRQLATDWAGAFERRGVAGVPKLVMSEAGNFPQLAQDYVRDVIHRSRRLFARVLKRGIRDGVFREVDIPHAVHALLSPIIYAQLHRASLGPWDPGAFDSEPFLATHLDIFLRGIAAPRGS